MKVLVGNIQRFCLDDGPGIRTTVFLKGCSIRCPWCCNPENLDSEILIGQSGFVYGKYMSEEDILSILLKDKHYYQDNGGVTFSGGECLLTLHKMQILIKGLKSNGIRIAIETSLFVPTSNLSEIIDDVEYLYVDFKILSKERSLKILSGDLNLFLKNLDYLKLHKAIDKVHPRIPLVPKYTDDIENINKIIEIFKEYGFSNVEIFSIHNIGSEKYKDLGINYEPFQIMSENEINRIVKSFKDNQIQVKVLNI